MARDLSLEPIFPTFDIQGDILVGLLKKTEHLLFFHIEDVDVFKDFLNDLDVTSMQDVLDIQAVVAERKALGDRSLVSTPGLNVAFTAAGLAELGISVGSMPEDHPFRAGMASRAAILLDPPVDEWAILRPGPLAVHGLFIATGATTAEVANLVSLRLAPASGAGWRVLHEEVGVVRPEPVKGHEHFGFADGVSQPGVRGLVAPGVPLVPGHSPDPNQGDPGQDLLWPGEFVFGFPGQDPGAAKFFVPGAVKAAPLPFMDHGAFLVFRRLAQRVPEFNAAVKAAARTTGGATDVASAELLGAQMVGRWKSGAPIILAPTSDDPALADGEPHTNDFEFGDDREGVLCPWAAHIRKAYPRNDVRHDTDPAPEDIDAAESFTQTHRMLRRGIAFGPELTEREALSGVSSDRHSRGLLFKCYVTDLAAQFEFVQRSWVDAGDFPQAGSGIDPIIGQSAGKPFLGAAPVSLDPARKPSLGFGAFVEMQGGAYFFAPSITALRAL